MTLFVLLCSLFLNSLYCCNIFQICRISDDTPRKRWGWVLIGMQFVFTGISRYTEGSNDWLKLCLASTLISYLMLILNPVLLMHKKKQAFYISVSVLVLDSVFQSLVQFLLNCFSAEQVSPLLLKSCSMLLNLFLLFVLIRLQEGRRKQIQEIIMFIPNHIYVMILITLFLAELLCSVNVFGLHDSEMKNIIVVSTSFLLLPMIAFIIGTLFYNFSSKHYYEHTSNLMKKQLEDQIQHYRKMDQNTYNRRAFLHDYRNHLILIHSVLQSGNTEKALELVSGLIEKSGAFSGSRGSFRSGNDAADAIFENKCAAAAEQQIAFHFEGIISPNIPVFQLCTILSNALDNAVEASMQVENEKKPAITVRASIVQNFQILIIENPHANRAPSIQTTKKDQDAHGFGLYNIKRSVNDLGGNMDIRFQPEIYTLEITFPIPKQKAPSVV